MYFGWYLPQSLLSQRPNSSGTLAIVAHSIHSAMLKLYFVVVFIFICLWFEPHLHTVKEVLTVYFAFQLSVCVEYETSSIWLSVWASGWSMRRLLPARPWNGWSQNRRPESSSRTSSHSVRFVLKIGVYCVRIRQYPDGTVSVFVKRFILKMNNTFFVSVEVSWYVYVITNYRRWSWNNNS